MGRDPQRIKPFLEQLGNIWETKCPDWRFGQMMMNVLGEMAAQKRDPFFPEEDEMIEFFKKYFNVEDKT